MRYPAILIAFCIAILLGLPHASNAAPSPIGLNVRDFGAVGNGTTNDITAFRNAVAQAATTGETVVVPCGRYRLNGTLVLDGVAMMGISSGNWNSDNSAMPTILPKSTTGPGIRLRGAASVRGLQFVYEWGTSTPSSRPATIELAGNGVRVSEVRIEGAWDAIMADGVSNIGRTIIEDSYIHNVHHIGVRCLGTWDVSWICNVRISSPNSQSFPLSGTGFLLGKNDVLLMSNCSVANAFTGYSMVDQIAGCVIPGGMWGSLSDCSADATSVALSIDGSGHYVSIVGGSLSSQGIGLRITGSGAQAQVCGVEISAATGPAVSVEDSISLSVTSCQIDRYSTASTQPAVMISAGDATTIVGNVITSTAAGVQSTPGQANLVISANVVRQAEGSFTGVVRDCAGAAISGATLTAIGPGTCSTTSGVDGAYTVSGAAVGSYNVSAAMPAYHTQTFAAAVPSNGSSSVIDFALAPWKMSEVKLLSDNTQVDLLGQKVAALFGDGGCIYVEQTDRSCGIRVVASGSGLAIGDTVNVSGRVTTLKPDSIHGSERQITSPSVTWVSSGAPLQPLGMNCEAVGGAVIPPNVPGVAGAVGINNIGLLVKIAGKVTLVLGNYVYVDDGSNIADVPGRTGVMVESPTAPTVIPGNIVSVTGIVAGSIPSGWTENRRYIKLRDAADLALVSSNIGTITGTVADSAAAAVSGAAVSTMSGGYSATTDSTGAYTLTGVVAGKHTVEASRAGYTTASSMVTLAADQNLTVNLTIDSNTGTLQGIVRDSRSVGIAGANVTTDTGGYSATTNSGGGYTISYVTAGTYAVTASKTGYSPQTKTGTVTAGDSSFVNFVLQTSP